jgi:hypothetical protein
MIESILIASAGVLIIIGVAADIIWTMMGEGTGFLTKRISAFLWRFFRGIHRIGFSDYSLLAFGISVIIFSLLILILLLWSGWFLLFFSTHDSVVHAITNEPGNIWDKIYFTGFTLFTLGIGDFVPNGVFWQLITPLATLCGLFIVTFSITYLVPVVQSASSRRSLAIYLSSLGNSPEEIINNFRNENDFSELLNQLNQVSKELAILEQRHKAYPVLYYLHSVEKKESLSLSLSRLNDALNIILYGLKNPIPGKEKIFTFKRNIDFFLETLNDAYIDAVEEDPPLPDLRNLSDSTGFVEQQIFEDNAAIESRRRKLLHGYIKAEGRRWDQINLNNKN